MPSLTAIVLLLCLALSCVHAERCGRGNQCVPHHLCNIDFAEEEPEVDLRKLKSGNQGCPSTKTCCPAANVVQEKDLKESSNQEPERFDCGQVNENGVTFRIKSANGLAQENEVPWMTALLHSNGTFLGGGSLIALDVVLTAHHRVGAFDSDKIVVRAGEWDLNTDTEMLPFVEVGVREIVLHPNFNRRNGANNLALLFLKKPFKATRHIRPICLPSSNQNFDRKRCFVTGWGKDATDQSYFLNIMKKVDLPVVSRRVCEAIMKHHKGTFFKLHSSLMCAGGEEGKDACSGDGGSPLACPLENDPKRFEQAGIVNWGVGCATKHTPGVYTDVAKFRSWIDEQISRHTSTNVESHLGKDEQTSDDEDEDVYYEATPSNRPPRKRQPEEPVTRSPNEIDPDDLYVMPSTMEYDDEEETVMIKST